MIRLILFVLLPVILQAQHDTDSTVVSNIKLTEIAMEKQLLLQHLNKSKEIISEQDSLINLQKKQIAYDSLIIEFKNLQISEQSKIITIQGNYNKTPWYKPLIYYLLGAVTLYTASELVSNIHE